MYTSVSQCLLITNETESSQSGQHVDVDPYAMKTQCVSWTAAGEINQWLIHLRQTWPFFMNLCWKIMMIHTLTTAHNVVIRLHCFIYQGFPVCSKRIHSAWSSCSHLQSPCADLYFWLWWCAEVVFDGETVAGRNAGQYHRLCLKMDRSPLNPNIQDWRQNIPDMVVVMMELRPIMIRCQLSIMEFIIYTAACHQGAVKIIWLHCWGAFMASFFIHSLWSHTVNEQQLISGTNIHLVPWTGFNSLK